MSPVSSEILSLDPVTVELDSLPEEMTREDAQAQAYNSTNLLLDYLHAEGTRYVFGVPGGAIAEFMRAVSTSEQIQFIVTRHEGGGSFMADGYARVSGKLGVCISTTGPGASNMLTGVSVAHFDGVPLLAISGCTARREVGMGALQETSPRGVSTADIYRPVSHYAEVVQSAEALPTALRTALRHCWTGAGGAAYIGMPTDLTTAPADPRYTPKHTNQYRRTPKLCDEEAAQRAAQLLAQAKSPIIFAGSGARGDDSRDALVRLAERLGAGVATSCKAKGVFPEEHPLALRNFGVAGSLWANEWVVHPKHDLILVLGSSLSDWGTGSWNKGLFENRTVIQVDIDPRHLCRWAFIDEAVIGDMSLALDALHRHLDELPVSAKDMMYRRQALLDLKESRPHATKLEMEESDSVPLKPQRVIRELETVLPDDGIVFVDSGNTTAWTMHHLTIRRQQQFICGMRMLSMGYSYAASIGGKLAAPDKAVIAIGGDGALLMNGTELHTAVQLKLPVVWICFYDGQLGTVYHGNKVVIGSGVYADMSPMDPVRFAESLGAVGVSVEQPGDLCKALPEALARKDRPTLISVVVDPMEPPPFGARFQSLTNQMGTTIGARED